MRAYCNIARDVLVLTAALGPTALAGPSFAEQSFSMQAPPSPAFTYRVTPTNQLIKPSPATLRFSRSDPGTSCDKVVEVGVNAGSPRADPGGTAPGHGDANAVLYTSPVGGGGGLCSFNYQDNGVSFSVPPHVDSVITQNLTNACIAAVPFTDPGANPPPYVPRRQTTTHRHSFVYKVFLKKATGDYEWRAPLPCDRVTPFSCWIEYETICEAIPNRPPQFEVAEVLPASLPAEGGQIRIRVIASDDHGVRLVKTTPRIEGESTIFAPLNMTRASGLGRASNGDNRSQWETVFAVPPNRVRTARTISFTFDVLDWDGAGTGVAGAGTKRAQQAAGHDFTPPQVLGFDVMPQSMQPYGGDVTLTVKASDNLGISTVTALLRDPAGRESSVQMPLASGTPTNGEWKITQTIPPNSGSTWLTYTVKATVVDTDGNRVETNPKTVGVNHDQAAPQLLSFTLTPQALPAAGGDVTLSVKASDDGVVQAVTTYYTKPGGQEAAMHLPLVSGTQRNGEWRASWREHPNTGSTPLVASVRVSVRDAAGKVTNSQPVSITVAPPAQSSSPQTPVPATAPGPSATPALPAAPPQVLGFSVTPTTLPGQGGEMTVAVRATDTRGVQKVTALVVLPDGRQHAMPLPLVAGTAANGEWRAKWTVPANPGTGPVSYRISALVADQENNSVSSQPVTITVSPATAAQPGQTRPGASAPPAPTRPSAPTGLR